jgi:hypothetical protein
MSPGRWGRGKTLTFDSARADNAGMGSRRTSPYRRAARRLGIERGQALVEFALIAPLFLMLVVGIIQFGVALNFWLDMQRIANQGARWAVVDAYPGCPRTSPPGLGCAAPGAFQTFLSNEKIAKGEVINPYICFEAKTGPGGTAAAGDPVTVTINRPFTFNLIVGHVGTINLHAAATMRTEWAPTVYTEDGPC